jgi:hypothetical protein
MNKRMYLGIVGIVGFIFDYIGFQSSIDDYHKFVVNGKWPTPNLESDFNTELLRWGIVGFISLIFTFIGYIGWKDRNQ